MVQGSGSVVNILQAHALGLRASAYRMLDWKVSVWGVMWAEGILLLLPGPALEHLQQSRLH
jgi:hypothetical protein